MKKIIVHELIFGSTFWANDHTNGMEYIFQRIEANDFGTMYVKDERNYTSLLGFVTTYLEGDEVHVVFSKLIK